MKLVVMRHGKAEPLAESDASRELTDKGRKHVVEISNRIVSALENSGSLGAPVLLFHSPYVRTTQTAQLLHGVLVEKGIAVERKGPVPDDHLLGSNTAESVAIWLDGIHNAEGDDGLKDQTMIIVSHQPLVSALVGWLVEGVTGSALHRYPEFSMATSSTAVLRGEVIDRGQMALETMIHR